MSYRSSNVKETCGKLEKLLYSCLYKEWSLENHSKIYTFITAVIEVLREIMANITASLIGIAVIM